MIQSPSTTNKNGAKFDPTEQRLRALESFKDWSNYLLVTTVAALGWVSTKDAPHLLPTWTRTWCIWSFALSILFSILTLALVPHVAELIDGKHSIYNVHWDGWYFKFELFHFCLPSHVFFLAGVMLYAIGCTSGATPTLTLPPTACWI